MRSTRSISIPLSLGITCCVWFAFLWTMQHAPVSRRAGSGEDISGARSSGGLANNFATAVVKFFDNQDPREMEEGASPVEPFFDSEMVEYLPLPKVDQKELAKDLPEVFANLSLTPRNLLRSDVDLDGDRDLDLALLVRLSKTEAVGAVLEYVGDEKFRFAGKFSCQYTKAEDFPRCFQVVLTGAGKMHLLSRTQVLPGETKETPTEGVSKGSDGKLENSKRAGWQWLRLEGGALVKAGEFEDPLCSPGIRSASAIHAETQVQPVPDTREDWIRLMAQCGDKTLCRVYGVDTRMGVGTGNGQARRVADPPQAACAP